MKLGEFIRSLPPAVEFAVVFFTAFAIPLYGSLATASDLPATVEFSGASLRSQILWEVFTLVMLGWFLSVRRWDFARQPLYPSWTECGVGLFLAAGISIVGTLLWPIIIGALPASMMGGEVIVVDLDWPTLIAASIVNPVFEEFLVCAYIMTALAPRFGMLVAIFASVGVRAAYHTYQGAPGFIYAAMVGVVFALWFARTRQLWPPIIAHAGLDFVGLIASPG